MTNQEQTAAFGEEMDRLIDRFRKEYDLTYATIIGMLEYKKYLLCEELKGDQD